MYGVDERSLIIGRGSDEAIDLLVRTFCRSGQDSILICPPTYGVYEVAAQIQGASVVRVPLVQSQGGFALNEQKIRDVVSAEQPRTKLVFICSPNNPTGTALDRSAIARVCEVAEGRAIVVVDEAYAEFSSEKSMLSELARFENLVVLRTLSKAWALAGARCGVAIGSPSVVSLLHKVRAPYPLATPTIRVVLDATDPDQRASLRERVRALNEAKQQLAARLRSMSGVHEVFSSQANFLLVRFKDSGEVMRATRLAGIILRDRSREPGLVGCVRISIGTEEENDALLRVLREVAV